MTPDPHAPAAAPFPPFRSPSAAGAPFHRLRWPRLVVPLLLAALLVPGAAAAEWPELRLASTWRGADDVDVAALAWYARAPRWTRAHRLEISAGAARDDARTRPILFTGAVWRLASAGRPLFAEFSFGPTVIGGSRLGGRDLGGNWHFRSALALGRTFGERRAFTVALRLSHISNGGLRNPNPGLDTIGLSFVSGAGRR